MPTVDETAASRVRTRMTESSRPSHAAYVQIERPDGGSLYAGEAIYRPARAHPQTGEAMPMIGVPDDSMTERPDPAAAYELWYNGEPIPVVAVYLERVSTCWWFVLSKPPRHPPTA